MKRFLWAIPLFFANAFLLYRTWTLGGNLGWLMLFTIGTTVLAGRLLYTKPAATNALLPESPSPEGPRAGLGSWLRFFVGLALAVQAARYGFKSSWWPMLWASALSAFFLRPLLPVSEAPLQKRLEVGLLLSVAAIAALFRFWDREGSSFYFSPLVTDEALIWLKSRLILAGERQTFAIGPGGLSDGSIPFYLSALSIKLFGDSLQGFRTVNGMLGVLNVLLIAAIARESLGPRLGVLCGAIAATAAWPVAYSRANYLMNESLFLYLAGMALLLWGLRRRSGALLALAGAAMGASLNAYKAGQLLPLLIALFFALTWLLQPERRADLRSALLPLIAGYLIAATPLLLWFYQNPKAAMSVYFNSLAPGAHTIGHVSSDPLVKAWTLLKRAHFYMGDLLKLFTKSGPWTPSYFPTEIPLLSKPLVALVVAGLIGMMARPKRFPWLFIFAWVLVGLLPASMANPGELLNDRRVVLALPPILLLAGLGLHSASELLSFAWARPSRGLRRSLAVGLLISAALIPLHWNDYFQKVQRSPTRMAAGRANLARYSELISEQYNKTPFRLLSYLRWNSEAWANPKLDPGRLEFTVFVPKIKQVIGRSAPGWFQGKGVFDTLSTDPGKDSDGKQLLWAVSLTPFDYYLLPMLQSLGKADVYDVPILQTKAGPLYDSIGMLPDDKSFAKLVVFRDLDPSAIEAARSRYRYVYEFTDLDDPYGDTAKQYVKTKEHFERVYEIWKQPYRWKAKQKDRFIMAGPWFWTEFGGGAGAVNAPFRMKGRFILKLKEPGMYALGASTPSPVRVRLDGKIVYEGRGDEDATPIKDQKIGYLGKPIQLDAGEHRLEVETLVLSAVGGNNLLLRLVWQPPGGEKETLPLEVLYPAP